jgi:uncharacterized DUF497 family protein
LILPTFGKSLITTSQPIIYNRFDYGEVRYLTFGLLRGDVIVVAHTEIDDTFRIISVRKAEKYEQEIYFNAIWN